MQKVLMQINAVKDDSSTSTRGEVETATGIETETEADIWIEGVGIQTTEAKIEPRAETRTATGITHEIETKIGRRLRRANEVNRERKIAAIV